MKKALILSSVLLMALPLCLATPAFSQSSPNPENAEQRREKFTEQLNLTESQQAQWQEIKQSSRDRMLTILTPEQQAQIQDNFQQGQGRKNWRSLNLTDDQKEQIRAIREETRQQVQAILTPEQQQVLEEMKSNRRSNR
ncbi:MAG: hypothetical protein AAGF26_02510 [Cyanobacteria bacterium P01_G01_bin.49]